MNLLQVTISEEMTFILKGAGGVALALIVYYEKGYRKDIKGMLELFQREFQSVRERLDKVEQKQEDCRYCPPYGHGLGAARNEQAHSVDRAEKGGD